MRGRHDGPSKCIVTVFSTIPAWDQQSAIHIQLRRATIGVSPLVRIPSKWAGGLQQKEARKRAVELEWVVFNILNLRIDYETGDRID
jgi:hypothetical protein